MTVGSTSADRENWHDNCPLDSELLHSQSEDEAMAHREFHSCIEACTECAQACEHCASACLSEKDVKMMAQCIRLDRDCLPKRTAL